MKESVIKLIEVIMNKQELINKVKEFLDTLDVEYLENDTSLLGDETLEFYIPSKAVAVVVNDFATHNSTYCENGTPKSKRYHLQLTDKCLEKNVRLIHAWEHCINEELDCKFGSWEVLKNVIKSACSIYDRTIYARKTKVVEFPAKELKKFFDTNNINGFRSCSTAYCLVPKEIENPTPDDVLMTYGVGHCYFGKRKIFC